MDTLTLYAVTLVPLVAIVAVVLLFWLLGRGKMLKCPDCGEVFRAPVMDEKILSGGGWTLPYMGRVGCPKCHERRSRRDYQKVPSGPT
ncbi:MAG: hypothetical protein JRN08_03325 [Nitrososphaerota archaeon]|nr:hypothetical protein [Nitrososphaerota archaeon]